MERRFYRVSGNTDDAPIRDHLLHGYEERRDFYLAVRRLCRLWHDRVGECIGERHGFLLLRFHDTPGGKPDEEWLPEYLLKETDMPEYLKETQEPADDLEAELDRSLGFD